MMMLGIAFDANVFTVLGIGTYRVLEAESAQRGISRASTHIGRPNKPFSKRIQQSFNTF
jgi:hypothetical protein